MSSAAVVISALRVKFKIECIVFCNHNDPYNLVELHGKNIVDPDLKNYSGLVLFVNMPTCFYNVIPFRG